MRKQYEGLAEKVEEKGNHAVKGAVVKDVKGALSRFISQQCELLRIPIDDNPKFK